MLRMLSDFLTEDVFKLGLQVRPCRCRGGEDSPPCGVGASWQAALGVSCALELPLLTHPSWCSVSVLPPHLRLQQHRLHRPLDSSAAGRRGLAAPGGSPHHSPFAAAALVLWGLTGGTGFLSHAVRGVQHLPSPAPHPFPSRAGDRSHCPSLQAVTEKNISLPGTISTIMDRWTLQMGFPVVTVDTSTGVISQTHFLLDPDSKVERPSVFK